MNMKQFKLVAGFPHDLREALEKMWEEGKTVDDVQIVVNPDNGEYHFFIFYSKYKAK